jgi:hypothetical protein
MSAQPEEKVDGRMGARNIEPAPKRRFIVVGKSRIPKPAQVRMEEARERQLRALDLRKARVTYGDIAKALGYSDASSARAAVQSAMKRQEFELAKEVALLDLTTLDEMQMRCMDALRKGDLFQVDRILRIMERRYGLLGVGQRTVEELQEQFGVRPNGTAVQNNGVMVINAQAGTADFVRSMMSAVGIDVDSPEAKKKLRELEAPTSQKPPHRERIIKKTVVEELPAGTETLDDTEIVDAEFVEDDE